MDHSQPTVDCPNCHWVHKPKAGLLHNGKYKGICQKCGNEIVFRSTISPKQTVTLMVNGEQYSVSNEDISLPLNEFLRERCNLPGTKKMCYQGGCGACIVSATYKNPVTQKNCSIAINSCLRPVFSCDGWSITTTEGIGNSKKGFHKIQDALAEHNGSQCGYCSPGMVMSMYSLLAEKPNANESDVEKAFDGNICRCTGYRSIMDGMKSLVQNGDSVDIEDLSKLVCCKKKKNAQSLFRDYDVPIYVPLTDASWFKPDSLKSLYGILNNLQGKSYKLLFGDTGKGVYREPGVDVTIALHGIQELYNHSISDDHVFIGANVNLSDLSDILQNASMKPGFSHLENAFLIIEKVANKPVRNVASWVGNLVMKQRHPDFVSDVLTILETAEAILQVVNSTDGIMTPMSPSAFVSATSLTNKVVLGMSLKPMPPSSHFRLYKVMARSRNAHSYVNSGMNIVQDSNGTIIKASIIFGGITPRFLHATQTETYLVGKLLNSNESLQAALSVLDKEIQPDDSNPVAGSAIYRKQVSLAFFYRFALDLNRTLASPRYLSGAHEILRGLSSGKQDYDTDTAKYPLTEPMPKMSAKLQASGEASYVDSLPPQSGELFAQFVLSSCGNADIESIDATKALAMPGVVAFLTSKDIPAGGTNNFMPYSGSDQEEILCSGHIEYAGQPLGIIVAENHGLAMSAGNLVQVKYKNMKTPITTIQDGIKKKSFFPKPADDLVIGDADAAITNAYAKIKGSINLETQYHFHMETQACVSLPTESGIKVFATTQWTDQVQQAVAGVLNIRNNKVEVEVARLGGAYGGKISRNAQISAACALASFVTNRPVRLSLTLDANMRMVGKRFPYYAEYEAGVNSEGILQGVKINYFCDSGCSANEAGVSLAMECADNAYYCPNWHLSCNLVKTNTPSNTACRSPGTLPGILISEAIMEHMAEALKMDPLQFKSKNLYQKGQVDITKTTLNYCNISYIVNGLSVKADIPSRRQAIYKFNQENRWKKKAISVVPIKFPVSYGGAFYDVNVSIYNGDGSVGITHGGIEVGQGINTKVMQVCAYELDIPIDLIEVSPSNTRQTANSVTTGGSITSEVCCKGIIACCDILKARLKPIKDSMQNPTWKELIQKAYSMEIDLNARNWSNPQTDSFSVYRSYGATCAEVELDVLTGEFNISRVDILFDCGQSMNPEIDIGQIEGAFMMGIGYSLLEKIIYDETTGENLVTSTWDYKPPLNSDLPVDFRISLLKDAPNPLGVLGSKAVGEPPMCMSCSVLFALQRATLEARQEQGIQSHVSFGPPTLVEDLQTNCLPDYKKYLLN